MTYDPNEPRDDHGQWSSEGGVNDTHPSGVAITLRDKANAEHADLIAGIASGVAKQLQFDPKMVRISDEEKTFELNGKKLNYAGAAVLHDPNRSDRPPPPDAGHVTLYTGHVSEKDAAGITAHEIAHQKYQAFVSDYHGEAKKVEADPAYGQVPKWAVYDPENPQHVAWKAAGAMISTDGHIREKGMERGDGTLNEPWASHYPVYQAYKEAMKPGMDEFQKTDGVTDYSREYWTAVANGTTNTALHAYHETLAEISRLKHEKQPVTHVVTKMKPYGPAGEKVPIKNIVKLSPAWNKLHKAVEANWKRRSK